MKRAILFIRIALPVLTILSCSSSKNNKTSQAMSLESVLTSKEWKIEEIRFLQDNRMYYYKRNIGGDINFDQDKLAFKADKTGTYWKASNDSYNMTWNFVDPNKSKLTVTINYSPTPLTLIMENITFTETSLKYTEYYTLPNGIRSLASVWRTAL